nr:saccharopine dehydrogenase NADP-binding domain-containing protein [Kineosporia babensis]
MIGVLGASGEVGRVAADRIAAAGLGRLRVGGRDRAKAEKVAQELPLAADAPPVEVQAVDLDDDEALARFCEGCAVVVNCAGPSYRVLDRVARAAWAAGADHVDVGGELVARDALASSADGKRIAIFSAGVMPGLSGLLPRLLAVRPLRRMETYVGGAARFTSISAVDALLTRGDRFGTAQASWVDGAIRPNVLGPLRNVVLPGFPQPMQALPFLTTEAQELPAREVRAYNVFASDRIPAALTQAWAELPVGASAEELRPYAPDVVSAADSDVDEYGAFYVLLVSARPEPGGPPGPGRVVMRATDSYALSGVVMAAAARAVLEGTLVPGSHLAAEALDPFAVAEILRADPLVHELTVV